MTVSISLKSILKLQLPIDDGGQVFYFIILLFFELLIYDL